MTYNREPDEAARSPDILKCLPESLLTVPDSSENRVIFAFRKHAHEYSSRKFLLYANGRLDASFYGLDPGTYTLRNLSRTEIDQIIKKLNDWGYFGLDRGSLFSKFFVRKAGCISPGGSCCFNSSGTRIYISSNFNYPGVSYYQCTVQFVNLKHEIHYSPGEFREFKTAKEVIILDSCMAYLENALLYEAGN